MLQVPFWVVGKKLKAAILILLPTPRLRKRGRVVLHWHAFAPAHSQTSGSGRVIELTHNEFWKMGNKLNELSMTTTVSYVFIVCISTAWFSE